MLVFFFDWCGDHRALHSFPTRRSSDLQTPSGARCERALHSYARGGPIRNAPFPVRTDRRQGLRRSEEHTSELQSRPHLVCRLLLEKKNNRPPKGLTSTTVFNHSHLTCL